MKNKFLILFLMLSFGLFAQTTISMQQAIERVTTQHPTVLQQDIITKQQLILKDAAKGHPAMNIGYSFEEFGVAGFGVHSIGVQQTFNMPAVWKKNALYQEAVAKGSALQKVATQKQLKQYISSLYQQALFAKSQQNLFNELAVVYKKIELIAQKKEAVGETGKLPVLATQSALQQLELTKMSSYQNYLIQLEQLKQFLLDSSLVGMVDSNLTLLPYSIRALNLETHPLVQQINQNIAINKAQSAVIETQLLPQLYLGVQPQIVDRTVPNFAAQFGMNVPIFNKGIKTQVKANELNSKFLEQSKFWQLEQLQAQENIALQNIKQLQEQLLYLEKNILPTLQQQQELLEKAYAVGEVDYLNVLQSLQQIINARSSYLQVLYQLNLTWISYEYLVVD